MGVISQKTDDDSTVHILTKLLYPYSRLFGHDSDGPLSVTYVLPVFFDYSRYYIIAQ